MAKRAVRFTYSTGLARKLYSNPRLSGSWDADGRLSSSWTTVAMNDGTGWDGTQEFTAKVELEEAQLGRTFRWGVSFEAPGAGRIWGIATEIGALDSTERVRSFSLDDPAPGGIQQERYNLCEQYWLGANARRLQGGSRLGLQFAVWAPNAQRVEVVFGSREAGYISDRGDGIVSTLPALPMRRDRGGVWMTDVLEDFHRFDHQPYMFRITKRGGRVAYRTDLYSRCQIGSGDVDPQGQPWTGPRTELDGTKGCSVVVNPRTVAKNLAETTWPEHEFIPEEQFWQSELAPARPLPARLEDLVIYELHIGSLGYPKEGAGSFEDAIAFLDHLSSLGVNAVELMPMNEFDGTLDWGYSTSHYFAFEYSAGGRDQFKHFVRACHQRGIAVILDVVYNHYHHRAERAEWAYDADEPEFNSYYWYEGHPGDYPGFEYAAAHPDPADPHPPVPGHGGYVDNQSTGYAPRFHEEMVRKLFISSAVALVENFHIDGFRVDQTTSMHAYNVLHADGRPLGNVNTFGAKFLREYCRTLKMIAPRLFLIAEDHSGWDMVTRPTDEGGLGFDATWYADFYHHLVGTQARTGSYACLVHRASAGGDDELPMERFADALRGAGYRRIVYHESHDEAGNAEGTGRTMNEAVRWAPMTDSTRPYAEARARFAVGMALTSPGTPMFFMGEEIASTRDFKYRGFRLARQDLAGEANGAGRFMFQFYRDAIKLRRGLTSGNNSVVYVHNRDRIVAFRRWGDNGEYLVIGSLSNRPFDRGYTIQGVAGLDGQWREVLNSDAGVYGGANVGNQSGIVTASNGSIRLNIPANGVVVLRRQ